MRRKKIFNQSKKKKMMGRLHLKKGTQKNLLETRKLLYQNNKWKLSLKNLKIWRKKSFN